jgi:hypothetical protein
MGSRRHTAVVLAAATLLLLTAGFAAVALARAEPAGNDQDATAVERGPQGRAQGSTPVLADALHDDPAAPPASPASSRRSLLPPELWDRYDPYERWIHDVPFEHTHDVR